MPSILSIVAFDKILSIPLSLKLVHDKTFFSKLNAKPNYSIQILG